MKKILFRLILLGIVVAAAWEGYRLFQSMPSRQVQIATTKVRKNDVIVRSYARGELRAVRSTTLIAPNLFGTVQVTRLAPLGSFAREKDLIVEFDDSEVNSRLEEKQLEIDQIDEQIKKAEADLNIRNNQDQVDLLRARFAVRRAELEVKRNELLADIDRKKNILNLDESKRRLQQLESDIKSRLEQARAELAVLQERKNKSVMELTREKQRLQQVKLLTPMSGLVAIRQNRQSGFFFPGMQIPDIREGDQVQPGMPIADVLDLSELEIVAKVGEIDRANLVEGQDVVIKLDALGNKSFHGKIKSMSGTASANIFSGDPGKKFDVLFSVDMRELLTGLNAKPEQVARVLATAEANRRKPAAPSMAGGMMPGGANLVAAGGPPAGGMAVAPVAPNASGPNAGPRQMIAMGGLGGPAGAPVATSMTPEQQQKVREAAQKLLGGKNPAQLTAEERQKLNTEMQKAMRDIMASAPKPGAAQTTARPAVAPSGAPMAMMMPMAAGQFSQREMENAKLPPPVEEDSQLDVLLRPGLLADVEIILEKIPSAINIPAQAIFEKDGKQIVYVRKGTIWEERAVKPLKRTESLIVISSGLQGGETIAMSDPNAKPGDKKKDKDKPAGGAGPMGGMPAGNKGGN